MSSVRSKDTRPEVIVRSLLHRRGFRFTLHDKKLPGTPDIVLPKYRTVVLVHGCFWHQHPTCRKATLPKQNSAFWEDKLRNNVERDRRVTSELTSLGWKVITIWECAVKATDELGATLASQIQSQAL